jgi:rod shape-determining protein MreB and related proteins
MLHVLRPTIYAQLSPERLAVRDVRSGRAFAGPPIGAVLPAPNARVIRVGDEARTASADRPLRIVNPFRHPRTLVADIEIGRQVLKGFLAKLMPFRVLPRLPVLVLHPRVDPEGGFTAIEIRALHELASGAGAAQVYLWQGRELLDRELRALQFPSGGRLLE